MMLTASYSRPTASASTPGSESGSIFTSASTKKTGNERFFASRRNYDIARGIDAQGQWRCRVLEQSWRIGGASGPEVAALQAFRADPALRVIRAWCIDLGVRAAQAAVIASGGGANSLEHPAQRLAL